jgi:hypothetical protein
MDALSLGKAGAAVARWFNQRQKEAVRAHYDACILEIAQAADAVAAAVVAASIKQDVLSPAVQAVLEEELGTPHFAARAHRLFTEMLSSPSKARRRRLAAVLIGGPQAVQEPDELERLDILVARLLDPDVNLLACIADEAKRAAAIRINNVDRGLSVFQRNGSWRLMRLGPLPPVGQKQEPVVTVIDGLALSALESSACIALGPSFQASQAGSRGTQSVRITDLGAFFLEALAREPVSSALGDEPVTPRK